MNSSRLKQWIFPVCCCLCLRPIEQGPAICNPCLNDLPLLSNPCLGCALPLPTTNSICGQCMTDTYAFNYTHSAFEYTKPVDWLVHQLKFGRKLYIADLMACLMANNLAKRGGSFPQILIPVPLSRWRLAKRGFNQATEIALGLTSKLGIPLNTRCYTRSRHTKPQSGLSAHARTRNLRAAFREIRPCKYRHVAIIDDVMTTGSTAQAMAQTLRESGVAVIEIWTFARSI